MSTNNLDVVVNDWRMSNISNSPGKPGDIGIEIELEGLLYPLSKDSKTLWVTKTEQSLRNGGIEYILRNPVPIKDIGKALDDLTDVLSKCKPELTIRCSTHIHVNIQKMTVREVISAIFAYYLVEEVLVRTQSPNRQGNLFCLRMSDAEEIAAALLSALEGNFLMSFADDHHRYAALNLNAMTKFGSLEFRFLDPMVDKATLKLWSELFYHLIHTGATMAPSHLLQLYDDLPVWTFIDELLGSESSAFLRNWYTSGKLNQLMHTNYDILKDLARVFEAKRKFEMPEGYWYDDLEPSPAPRRMKDAYNDFIAHDSPWVIATDGGLTNVDLANMLQHAAMANPHHRLHHPNVTPHPTPIPTGTINWYDIPIDFDDTGTLTTNNE